MTLDELSKLYYLSREIELDRVRLEELYNKAEGEGRRITGLPRGVEFVDRVSKYAAEIVDLKGIIEANIQRCYHEFNRLNRYIYSVEDAQIRMILSLRFVNGLPWRQVAASIGGGNTEDGVRMACMRFLSKY